jgi:hypothetical protein
MIVMNLSLFYDDHLLLLLLLVVVVVVEVVVVVLTMMMIQWLSQYVDVYHLMVKTNDYPLCEAIT